MPSFRYRRLSFLRRVHRRPVPTGLKLPGLAALALAAAALAAEGPEGVWMNEKQTVAVRVDLCEGGLCGRIVWLAKPYRKDGTLKPWCGLTVMDGFHPRGPGDWSEGTIYDPSSERRYRARIHTVTPERLELRAYVLVPLLGRTLRWWRIEAPPGPCPTEAAPGSPAGGLGAGLGMQYALAQRVR